jgi:hypothetical protein
VTIELDVADRSMVLSIADEAGGSVLPRTRVAWPSAATSVDEICFQAPAGATRPAIEFDALRIERVPPRD